jgi:hypothetical protein
LLIRCVLIQGWIQQNHTRLFDITTKISKGENTDDLFQLCIYELLNNRVINSIPDNEKFFYFARIVRNQYHSKNSKFHKVYRKHTFVELDSNMDIPQDDYEPEVITMEWVLQEVEKIKQEQWYLGQIFLLYLSKGANLTKLSKLTQIPINNLSRDIKIVKGILNNKLNEKLN